MKAEKNINAIDKSPPRSQRQAFALITFLKRRIKGEGKPSTSDHALLQTSKIMGCFLAVTIVLGLIPGVVYALPTPDVIVNILNIIPILTGAVVTAAGGIYYTVNRLLGPNASKIVIAALLGILIGTLSLLYNWHQNRVAERTSQLAVFLRCDLSVHNHTAKIRKAIVPKAFELWREFGNFRPININHVKDKLMKQPDATLIDTNERSIRYHAAMPCVRLEDKTIPFTHVRPSELSRYLEKVHSKDLYLTNFGYTAILPSAYDYDKTSFKKFEHIYLVGNIKDKDLYVWDDTTLRPSNKKNRVKDIEAPVSDLWSIRDEKAIAFPGIATLVPNKEMLDLLEDDNVFLLAPYGSYRRLSSVQNKDYLERLLYDVDKKRILSINMTAPTTSENLARIAKILDGSKFVVIGFTKYDWLYEGLDATYEIWRRLGKNPKRFKLIGFNVRLPEVVARKWEATARVSVLDKIRKPFWKIVKWQTDHLDISSGSALLLIAVALRFLFFPIGFIEACSRIKRAKMRSFLKANIKPLWAPSYDTLLKQINVSGAREIMGALLMLILVIPAYSIIKVPPAGIQNWHFIWIANLSKSNYMLNLFVGGLIFLKLRFGNGSNRLMVHILIALFFTFLLFLLPSSLMVYLLGVMVVTVLQEFLALILAKRSLKHALLL